MPIKKIIATTIAWLVLALVGFIGALLAVKVNSNVILPVVVTIAGLTGAIITLIKGLGSH